MSAALDELWFLGDLLGIFWSSMFRVFFFGFFSLVVGWGLHLEVSSDFLFSGFLKVGDIVDD